jgi:hypothetical protein
MQELLLGTWIPKIVAYSQQYPAQAFTGVLIAVLLLDFMFRERPPGRSDGGDFSISDFCGGDGDGGGD